MLVLLAAPMQKWWNDSAYHFYSSPMGRYRRRTRYRITTTDGRVTVDFSYGQEESSAWRQEFIPKTKWYPSRKSGPAHLPVERRVWMGPFATKQFYMHALIRDANVASRHVANHANNIMFNIMLFGFSGPELDVIVITCLPSSRLQYSSLCAVTGIFPLEFNESHQTV